MFGGPLKNKTENLVGWLVSWLVVLGLTAL